MTSTSVDQQELDILKAELAGLFEYVRRVKAEVSAIHAPTDDHENFAGMGEQLDAIVTASEQATHRIMDAMETIQNTVDSLRTRHAGADDAADFKAIEAATNDVFEACSFQDITGQRVNKITKSLTYVERHVLAVVDAWAQADIDNTAAAAPQRTDDEKLLNGPQLDGKGLNQAEIDALFD